LPTEVQVDVAMRLLGAAQDFQVQHVVDVVLSDPDLVELGRLELPVGPRQPAPTHIPGYEINHTLGARIAFTAEREGGYDLSFAVDQDAQHRSKTTISVVTRR
jgi:hypothetical protein